MEAAVEEKLKGGKPPKKAGDQGDDLAAQVEKNYDGVLTRKGKGNKEWQLTH